MLFRSAFRQSRKFLVQRQCHGTVHYAIAQIFQPFIVRGAEAAVGQGPAQQRAIPETVPNTPLYAIKIHDVGRVAVLCPASKAGNAKQPRDHFDVGLKSRQALTL